MQERATPYRRQGGRKLIAFSGGAAALMAAAEFAAAAPAVNNNLRPNKSTGSEKTLRHETSGPSREIIRQTDIRLSQLVLSIDKLHQQKRTNVWEEPAGPFATEFSISVARQDSNNLTVYDQFIAYVRNGESIPYDSKIIIGNTEAKFRQPSSQNPLSLQLWAELERNKIPTNQYVSTMFTTPAKNAPPYYRRFSLNEGSSTGSGVENSDSLRFPAAYMSKVVNDYLAEAQNIVDSFVDLAA